MYRSLNCVNAFVISLSRYYAVCNIDNPVSLGNNLGGLLFDSGRFVTKITATVAVCNGRPL